MTVERRGFGHVLTPCPNCGGEGVVVETGMDHACGGDDRLCQSRCPIPVPVQVACSTCGGLGEVEL